MLDAKKRTERMIRQLRAKGKLNPKTKVNVYIKNRETPYIDPYVEDLKNKKIKEVLKIIKTNFREPVINYGSSVADDNILANSLKKPIITIGPRGGNGHAPNEWISVKSLKELVKVYGLIENGLNY
jgi:acetylornithine deacetylase/succinyl-diaminopimelate desuccinylase-like protein